MILALVGVRKMLEIIFTKVSRSWKEGRKEESRMKEGRKSKKKVGRPWEKSQGRNEGGRKAKEGMKEGGSPRKE